MNLNQYSIAAAQPGLAIERVLNLWLPVPPAQEQSCIAKYIEHETADITKAVDRTQREIALLHEFRTRLIADVVTGKIDVRNIQLPDHKNEKELDELYEVEQLEAEETMDIEEVDDADN
jgi:type I restriction enzyme S subunit